MDRISAKDYHAETPWQMLMLSASIAHILDTQSPAHAYARHPKLGGTKGQRSKSFDQGTLIHAILLDTMADDLGIVDAKDWRTNAAKAERDAIEATGRSAVLAADLGKAMIAADRIRENLATFGIELTEGQAEATFTWTEAAESGRVVSCKGRTDYILSGVPGVLYDLKSTANAKPDACARSIVDYGYDIQMVAYERATGAPATLIFFELEEPYVVTPLRLSPTFQRMGLRKWQRAVNTWDRCLHSGIWPGYVRTIEDVDPAPWALSREMERDNDQDV